MGPLSASVAVDAPRERVFDLLTDLSVRPAFCDHFLADFHLEREEARGVGAAARFLVTAGRRLNMETVIVEVQRPFRIRESGRTGRWDRIPVHTVWEIVEGAGTVNTVSVTFWTEPSHPLDRLRELVRAARPLRRAWKRALERLRDLAESGAEEVPRVGVAGADRVPSAPQ
jgi:uncharacterized protein YndB with AHSA1/START domain